MTDEIRHAIGLAEELVVLLQELQEKHELAVQTRQGEDDESNS